MNNKEFIDTLLVSGRVNKKDLYSSLDDKYYTHVQIIANSKKFIGDIYKKLMSLPDINVGDILFILGMLILDFDFNDKEIGILLRRLRLLKACTNIKYDIQTMQIRKGLEEGKNTQIELYKCKIFNRDMKEVYLYHPETKREIYRVVKEKSDALYIFNSSNNRLVFDNIKYVIVSEKGFKLVSNDSYDRSIYVRDRYRFKIS